MMMNLTIDPWIPALRADGRRDLFSLQDLFAQAHELRDLAAKPHERIALMRLLLCITQAALDGPADEDAWEQCQPLIQPRVRAYLSKWRGSFELFGDGPRFLQLGNLKAGKESDEGNAATKLDLSLATGNNSTLFDNLAGDKRSIRAARAAVNLITFQNFSACGRIGIAKWNGKDTPGKGSSNHAPCTSSSMVHTFILGSCLLDTLFLNLLNKETIRENLTGGWGKPIWEHPITDFTGESAKNAGMTYLGRFVPLSRAIRLDDQGFSIILANGLEYPVFPAFRETSATIIKRKEELGLLSASTSRNLWRQLSAITVKRRAGAENGAGPLALVNLSEPREDITVWVGALIAAGNGKLVDVIESTYSLPPGMFSESAEFGRAAYEKGVAFAESYDEPSKGILMQAVKAYARSLKVAAPAYDRARQFFWTRVEQHLSSLFDLARNTDLAADLPNCAWGKAVQAAARAAYEQSCPRQTPRQIEAFALGLRRFNFRPKVNLQTTNTAHE
jgi:CRISPR system Cascade subunit CasA